MRTRWLPLLGLAAVLVVFTSITFSRSLGQEPRAPQRIKWEYKQVPEDKLAVEGGLAVLGDEGWELVHVDPKLPYLTRTSTEKHFGTNVSYTTRVYYLKRPK